MADLRFEFYTPLKISVAQSQPIAAVAGFILDPQGTLRYLILSDGSRFRPVPWDYFDPGADQDAEAGRLIYTDDPQRLSSASDFDTLEAAWGMSKPQEQVLRSFWGLE